MSSILGKELIVNIEAADAAGDIGALIGFLLYALGKAKEMERRVNEEDLPTNETFTGHMGE